MAKLLRKLSLLFPILFAVIMILGILFPVMFTGLFIAQLGLPPRATAIFAGSMILILDLVALIKLYERPWARELRVRWTLIVMLIPYAGSIACLFKDLEAEDRRIKA